MIPTYAETFADLSDRLTSVLTVTKVYRTQKLNRENWEQLAKDASLVPPYLILETGDERPNPFAMDAEGYALSVAAYYVVDLTANAVEDVAASLQAARTALVSSPLTLSSLMGGLPSLDVTEENPANRVFYSSLASRFAGMLSFDLFVGCGVYVDAP